MELLVTLLFAVCVIALGTVVGGVTARSSRSESIRRGIAIGLGFGIVAVIADYLYAWGAGSLLLHWGWIPGWGELPALVGLALVTISFAGVAPYILLRLPNRGRQLS